MIGYNYMKFFLIILLISSSCESSNQIAIFSSKDIDIFTVDTLKVRKFNQGNNFNYTIGKNNYQYQIDFLNSRRSFKFNGKEKGFTFNDSIEIFLNEQKISIFKFLANSSIIDGETAHYFTKNDGLILIQHTTWKSQIELCPWAQSVV